MLKEHVNKIRLLTQRCGLSINIIYLHIINKSKINNFVDKNIDKKLVMTKKGLSLLQKERKGGFIIFERNFIIYRLRPAFIGQGSMKKRMSTITIIFNFLGL